MSTTWFFKHYPPARSVIENDLRLTFWKAGLAAMWFTCTKEAAPFECQGLWGEEGFSLEWEPQNYLLLKMRAPNKDLLTAFERVLKHKALAAYRRDSVVIVEWRVKDADARYAELKATGVAELERLDGK
ncbi:MAG: hypothetical protein FJ009_02665 [Chloroflexi bacterium]|nr:hypothetical protein [Chloroflexota bacterium]